MNHYTYFLTAKEPFNGMKYYIGVRSCKSSPEEDKYMGSSKIIKRNKVAVDKHILATWNSRKEAVSHEILLHECFDVALNKEFFNQAKQTSTGFDTTGIEPPIKGKKLSFKSREKIRLSKIGKTYSEATKQLKSIKMVGYKHLKVTCPSCGKVGGETGMKKHHFDKCTGVRPFRASVCVNGKTKHLGYFSTKEKAKMAQKQFWSNQ
jgi:hypothetical protein